MVFPGSAARQATIVTKLRRFVSWYYVIEKVNILYPKASVIKPVDAFGSTAKIIY